MACPKLLLHHLENHLVRPLIAPQAEARAQVRFKIWDLLNSCHDGLVHLLLVLYSLGVGILLLRCGLAIFEEVILALALLLLTRPVFILAHTFHNLVVDARDIDNSGGRNDVAVVDAAKRDTV